MLKVKDLSETESYIQRIVCEYGESLGIVVKHTAITKGEPDRMFFKQGKVFFIEFKSKKGKLSSKQIHNFKVFRRELIDIYIVNNIALGKEVMDKYA